MKKLPLPIGVASVSLLLSACQPAILLPSVQGDMIGMQSAFMPITPTEVSSLMLPSVILVVQYAPSKQQNVIRAINAKGDAILYEDKEDHTIAISLNRPQTARQDMAFYKNIDGVQAVTENQSHVGHGTE